MTEKQLSFLTKAASPQRNLPRGGKLIYPSAQWQHGVPGRLVIFRTEIVKELFDFKITPFVDSTLSKAFPAAGYRVAIAAEVRHRHLSLLNLFDYPEYDDALRNSFFARGRPRDAHSTWENCPSRLQDI